jgi:hypothetical protein
MENQALIQLLIDLLPLLIPIILIQFGLAIYALIDLARRQQVKGPRWAWAVGLVLSAFSAPFGIVVSVVYLLWGRNVEVEYDTD